MAASGSRDLANIALNMEDIGGRGSGMAEYAANANATPAARRWSGAWWAGVFKSHIICWSSIVACGILWLAVEAVHPRTMFMLKDPAILSWKAYPHQDNTVPTWTVPLYSLIAPVLIFVVNTFARRRPRWELYLVLKSFLLAWFLTGMMTTCVKVPVGRPRPNFVMTCWPSGNITWAGETALGGYAVCEPGVEQGEVDEIKKSFPSGHSSMSAVGLGYLTYWMFGQLRSFAPGGGGQVWRFMLPLLPGFGAVAVGITRVIDYWHYPSDVVAGLALGFLTAFFLYRVTYPALTVPACDVPTCLLLEEQRKREQAE